MIEVLEEVCEEYVQSKQHKGNFNKYERTKTKCTLEVVFYVVRGQIQVDSIGGNKCFNTLINDFSRKLWFYVINKKSEVVEMYKKFKSMVEIQSG